MPLRRKKQLVDEVWQKREDAGNDAVDLWDPEILTLIQSLFEARTRDRDRVIVAENRIGLLACGIGGSRGGVRITRVITPDAKKMIHSTGNKQK